MKFNKYHGTGNDFIIIDNRLSQFPVQNIDLIKEMCRRHFGIGSDGLILIEEDPEQDFYMNFFNPDGSQSFCGNGSRCAGLYAYKNSICSKTFTFRAIDGVHEGQITRQHIEIKMSDVKKPLREAEDYIFQTGSPHYVRFEKDLDSIDLIEFGQKIRYSDKFKRDGINVNIIARKGDVLRMRTYERGVEDETLSCGTGVTAAALAASIQYNWEDEIEVETKGGSLKVRFQKFEDGFKEIWLCGPAKEIFKGNYAAM